MEWSEQTNEFLRLLVKQEREHTVILLDPAGQIVAWLGAAERTFGYAAAEMQGQHFSALFTPEDNAKQMPQYELNVAANNGHAEDDRWMLRKDGRRFWATGALIPLRDAAGQVVGHGKVLRNRTDLKGQLETAHRLIERLQKSNDSKNTFIATLAHELRSPLSSIATSLAILDTVGLKSPDCTFARATIQRQLDHMKRMIEDLMEVARAGVGKIQLHKRPVVLGDIVRAAVESCRPAIDKHTHKLELLMSDAPLTVEADSDRLRQVFINLIENAAKYTSYGGHIWVKVSVEGQEAVVKVEDDGIGISPEMLPRIFDLFTQAEFSDDRDNGGLGIGLSLVKDLVSQHGGTVQVRSDGLGKGSEFTIRLPLAGLDEDRPNAPTAEARE